MSYRSEVAADSPVRNLFLDETAGGTATDNTGGGNGSYQGTVNYAVSGVVGTAIEAGNWGGGSGHIQVNIPSLGTAFSIEFLYKYQGGTIIFRDATTTGGTFLQISGANLVLRHAGTDRTITGAASLVNDGNWHHIVITWNGTNVITYVDGSAIDTWARTSTTNPNNPLQFGRNGNNAGQYHHASYDEIAVYTTALSSGRVAVHDAAAFAPPAADLSVAGTMPLPTLAVSLTVALTDADLSVAATMPLPTLAVSLEAAEPSLSVAATMPLPTLAVALNSTAEVGLTVAGTMPSPTLAVALTAELVADLSVSATMPLPTLAVDLDVTPTTDGVSVGGTMPLPVLLVALEAEVIGSTDTSNDDDALDLDGIAEVFWEPDVTPIPAHISLGEHRTVARVITTPPTIGETFSPAAKTDQRIAGIRERLVVGDEDWTFLRGHHADFANVRLIDPLRYGSGSVTIPGVNPQFETEIDFDDLKHKRVVIQLVDEDDEIVDADYYRGFVAKANTNGTALVLELGGKASGRLSANYVPPPVDRRRQQAEHILVDLLRDARVPATKTDDYDVPLIRRGGSDGLTIFNETLAVTAGVVGDPLTCAPSANGPFVISEKNTTTIDGTAYIDSDLIVQDLSRDYMAERNRIYGRGRTPNGELVTGIRTPGLTQGETPDFPNDDDSPMAQPDTDADTDSGAGVTAVQEQLAIHNFYDVNDGTPGLFDDTLAQAVEQFQIFAGLNVTGEVGPNVWDALWNVASIGYSLDDAREYPLAEDPTVRKWNRTANGSKIAANPLYDEHSFPVAEFIDVGGPFGKGQIHKFARSKLAPEGGIWQGTLTFRSGYIAGEHNPEDPFTADMVRDRRSLRENMRLWLPYFAGGIVVYVSGVDHQPEETLAIVSTVPETTMETWTAIERAREAKSNPGNTWSGHVRRSQVRNDEVREWDSSSGWLANPVDLTGGDWTEVKIPAGQAGVVQRIKVVLEDPDEFAVILTQKPLAMGRLNTEDGLISFPLVDLRPTLRPWWENESIADWLESRGVLKAWGSAGNPCGYGRSQKTDDQGATAQPIKGWLIEEAGFNYQTGAEPVLYLYIWVENDNAVLPGRILRNQRTTDF